MNYLWAFLIGGFICIIGQILIDTTKMTPARILVLFVVLGVALQSVGIYQHIVNLAGCGATVPLTGFGYNLAKGTADAIKQDGWLGIVTGPLTAGAAGITTAIISGLVVSLITKPHDK